MSGECQKLEFIGKKKSYFLFGEAARTLEEVQLALPHFIIEDKFPLKYNAVRNTSNEPTDNSLHREEFIKLLDEMVRIDNKLPYVKDIFDHARLYVRTILEGVKNLESELKFNIIESGSSFSNIRVGLPYEFDFMIDLSPMFLTPDGVSYVVRRVDDKGKDSFFEIASEESDIFKHKNNGGYKYDSMYVLEKIFKYLSKSAELMQEEWNIIEDPTTDDSLAFVSKLYYHNTAISIDIVPCFKFPPNQYSDLIIMKESTEAYLKQLTKPLYRYMENIHHKLYLVCRGCASDRTLFRLSTSLIERDVFMLLDPAILRAIRLVKYFFQIFMVDVQSSLDESLPLQSTEFTSDSMVPSYMVISLILHWLVLDISIKDKSRSNSEICIVFLEMFSKTFYFHLQNDENLSLLELCHYGWCFENINSTECCFQVPCKVINEYFKNCIEGFIQVILENNRSSIDYFRYRVEPQQLCKKCYGKFLPKMWKNCRPHHFFWCGLCYIHKSLQRNEVIALSFNRAGGHCLVDLL